MGAGAREGERESGYQLEAQRLWTGRTQTGDRELGDWAGRQNQWNLAGGRRLGGPWQQDQGHGRHYCGTHLSHWSQEWRWVWALPRDLKVGANGTGIGPRGKNQGSRWGQSWR